MAMNAHRAPSICWLALLALPVIAGWARPVLADVLEADDSYFVSVHEIHIAASPKRVFEALIEEIGAWWDAAHTYSGDASNMTFELELALVEELPEDGFVRHLFVDMVQPPKVLRLSGGLGPLQPLGVTASMTFRLEEAEGGTQLAYRYVVSGRGLQGWAEPVDRVMGGQLRRLQRYVETGSPVVGEEAD